MSSFEKLDCDVEKFKSSLKSNYKVWFVDCENDIAFDVKFFDKTELSLKLLSLFEKKAKNANAFY